MIPLYILGLLQRFGPQHGYQIKKIIAGQLADFTLIKLPTIYYHLEKMAARGLLIASSEKPEPGGKPEKVIYSITEKGVSAFQEMLHGLLDFTYRPTFPSDGVFYFADNLEKAEITEHLENYLKKLTEILAVVEKHKKETLQFVPDEAKTIVKIIFSHHTHHYQAELDWAKESLSRLN